MTDIIIKLDKEGHIAEVEGIPKDMKVKILRPRQPSGATPEVPRLQWFSCHWFVLAGRSYVKCFNEQEAKALAVEHADESAPNGDEDGGVIKLPGGRKVKHDWYNTPDEEPYVESVDQDEDTLQRGAELDAEGA